jgi:hypothetical protein
MKRAIHFVGPALLLTACTEYDLGRDKDETVIVDDTGGPGDSGGDSDAPVDTGEPADSDPPIDETGLPPVATAPLYAHTSNTLFSVEPEAPWTHLRVGAFVDGSGVPVTDITDVAIDTDGIMYAVSFDKLYTVNPENGQVNEVGVAGPEDLNALTFLADGTLLAGGGSNLYQVDPSTGGFTQISSIGDWSFAGDMVGLPDGLLYCAMSNESSGWESALVIYDIDRQTILHTGNTGTGSMYGFAYADGTLFGFNADGEILTIDQSSGHATRVADTNEIWWGATTNPVTW